MQLDYLILAAHPDDAELYCGGTLIKMQELGYNVGILDFTRGEAGTVGTPAERAEETKTANKILRPAMRENLELPDSRLQDDRQTQQLVVDQIRKHKAKVIIAPWAPCRHPDHAVVSSLARAAHFFSGAGKFPSDYPPWRPLRVIYHLEYEEHRPSFVVDISDQFDAKMRAIDAYATQFYSDSNTAERTVVGSRRFRERMISRLSYYGNLIGCDYGEPYMIDEMMRIDDPLVELARENRENKA